MRLKIIEKSILACFLSIADLAIANEAKLLAIVPKFETYVAKAMKEWAVPGVAIAIATPDKIIYGKGFGTREVGKNKPVDADTVFQIASLTKMFTAALAGILENRRVFSLDDPVKRYLPAFDLSDRAVAAKVSLRDLISHRVGLGHFVGDSLIKLEFEPSAIVGKLATFPYLQRHREDYGYSNPFFGFMGIVVEKATGKTYATLLTENVFKPLRMKDSSVGKVLIERFDSILNRIKALFGKDANIALNHDRTPENRAVCVGLDPIVYLLPSTSGMNGSANDIGAFLRCLLSKGEAPSGESVIPEKFVADMLVSRVAVAIKPSDMQFPIDATRDVSYGTGLFGYEYGDKGRGLRVYGHMGGYVGQRTLVFICPEEKFAVCILSNLGHFNVSLFPEALRNKFLDLYLNRKDRDWSGEYLEKYKGYRLKRESKRLDKKLLKPAPKRDDAFYVGKYANLLYGELVVFADKKGLRFTLNGKTCSMAHFNGDEFTLKAWEFSKTLSRSDNQFIEFFKGGNGKTFVYVSFLDEGDNPFFEKIS